MKRKIVLLTLLFIIFRISELFGNNPVRAELIDENLIKQDTLWEDQILYNGRIWQNFYYMVKGDQFLFSKQYLPGSVTIRGRKFNNVSLSYDIYDDEILTPVSTGGILQLNKEMVDSFSVLFQNRTYRFVRMVDDSLKRSKEYFNVLYKGKTALYVRYNKKIEKLAVEGQFDEFYQLSRIYFVKDNVIHLIEGKSDLLNVFIEDKTLIKNFIKKNRLSISVKDPESFIPVIQYLDTKIR